MYGTGEVARSLISLLTLHLPLCSHMLNRTPTHWRLKHAVANVVGLEFACYPHELRLHIAVGLKWFAESVDFKSNWRLVDRSRQLYMYDSVR